MTTRPSAVNPVTAPAPLTSSDLEALYGALADTNNLVRSVAARQELLLAGASQVGQNMAELNQSAAQLVTINTNHAIGAAVGAVAFGGGHFAGGHFGYWEATPTSTAAWAVGGAVLGGVGAHFFQKIR